jgi:hypothetical protein
VAIMFIGVFSGAIVDIINALKGDNDGKSK